jgi:hypothetical protein
MKFLLITLLTVASIFGQTAEFVEAGAQSGKNIAGGVGVAQTLTAKTQLFVEVTEATGNPSTDVVLGIKTNYGTIDKITPFTIVAYGGAITALSKITTIVNSPTVTSLTTLGTAVGFAQQYAGGAEYKFPTFSLGIGAMVDHNSSSPWKAYPFLFLSKVF